MTMTISSIDPGDNLDSTTVDAAAVAVELIDIHCRAGHYVAELSESSLWVEADDLTIRLIAEASAIAGPIVRAQAEDVPAVVRCRDLAAAQRCMVAALDGIGLVNVDAGALIRARAILAELAEMCVTLRP